ncbi:Flavonoid 3'-monooxygenase [Sesamum angolense]|uniref:Flavonoid 3'-monooxygenase n=1 Tax=Sesamum angolense TaxID=2727404 RepID=A0AAE2BWJ8_9LAMI|nr:Flavonoid 3'-monooxygenase [Sesamum angolense]
MISLSDFSPLSAPLLILISLPIFWCLFMLFIKSGNKTPPMPPGPRGLPIVGYLPFLRPDMHIQFTELARQYGPIYKLWLGTKLCTVISSTSLVKEIIRDHDTIFANRDSTIATRICSYNENDIGFCPYNSGWRTRRKLFVHDMLSNSSLDATFSLRKDESECYNEHGVGKHVVGERKDRIEVALSPLVERSFDLVGKPNVSDFFPVLARFDIQGVEKELRNIMQRVDEIIEDIINERTKVGGGGNKNGGRLDFLQMLMELSEKEDVKTEIGRTQIKAMIAVSSLLLRFAYDSQYHLGYHNSRTDTSAATIEWVMADCMHNPEVIEKAQKELNEVVGLNNIVEDFHIPKLVYLDAVIKETLRIRPIGPFLTPRTPSQSCIVGGGNNFNYIPFGSGRRICAGLPLAERMLKYVLASLLHSFDWQPPKGEIVDMEGRFGVVLKKSTPLIAIPSPRVSKRGRKSFRTPIGTDETEETMANGCFQKL